MIPSFVKIHYKLVALQFINRMYSHQTNTMGNGKITDFDDT